MEITVLQTGPFAVNTCIVPLVDNQVFVVDCADCGFSGDRFLVRDYLNQKGLNPCAVVFTHGHFDHVSGLKDFVESFPGTPVLIHQQDSCFIGKDSAKLQGFSLGLMGFEEFVQEVSNLNEPTDFLKDGLTLGTLECFSKLDPKVIVQLNKWKVMSTPGHTPGSICLYSKDDNVLIAGDTVFYHSWGRTDLPLGSEETIQKSLDKIYRTLDLDAKVYPGHEKFGFRLRENL